VGSKQKRQMSFTRDQVPQSVLAIWPRVLACDEEKRKSKIGVKEGESTTTRLTIRVTKGMPIGCSLLINLK
jgi:hypothetical protein